MISFSQQMNDVFAVETEVVIDSKTLLQKPNTGYDAYMLFGSCLKLNTFKRHFGNDLNSGNCWYWIIFGNYYYSF